MDTDQYGNSSFISLMKIQNMEVKFSCETNMVPKPSITWLKNGKLFNGRAMGKVRNQISRVRNEPVSGKKSAEQYRKSYRQGKIM